MTACTLTPSALIRSIALAHIIYQLITSFHRCKAILLTDALARYGYRRKIVLVHLI